MDTNLYCRIIKHSEYGRNSDWRGFATPLISLNCLSGVAFIHGRSSLILDWIIQLSANVGT